MTSRRRNQAGRNGRETMNTITTKTGRTLRIRIARVGNAYVGQLVARNGRLVAEADPVRPFREGAEADAIALAAQI